jgi:predicted amidohydrolase YtcJ
MRETARDGRLGVRLWVMLSEEDAVIAGRLAELGALDDEHVAVRAIKRSIDGALGSHGAWLLEPYADLPESAGLNTLPVDSLERTARLALEAGFQLCVHAIGDRANRETLDVFARVLGSVPDGRERRWRIEHAQHLAPEDVPRFAELGVIASMQAVHCTSDAPWVPKRLGPERAAAGAYVWRKLLDSGAIVINGTDAPIEDVDPIPNFHAAVTRRTAAGEPFHPGQRMTRLEALRSYTIDAAYAAFEERLKGSLAPGKLADITVLSRDILSVPEDEILEAEIDLTVVGGHVLYERS